MEQYKADPDNFTVEGVKLEAGDLRVKYTLASAGLDQNLADKYEADSQNGILVLLNVIADASMKDEGTAREIINRVQKLRKEAKLVPTDQIRVYYRLPTPANGAGDKPVDLQRVVVDLKEFITSNLKTEFINLDTAQSPPAKYLIESDCDIKGETLQLAIERLASTANLKSRPKPAPGPFVPFANLQLKSGVRTVVKTALVENPIGTVLPSSVVGGWTVAGEQEKPLNQYVNIEVVNGTKNPTRATVLLETVTTASPFLGVKISTWEELRTNVSGHCILCCACCETNHFSVIRLLSPLVFFPLPSAICTWILSVSQSTT